MIFKKWKKLYNNLCEFQANLQGFISIVNIPAGMNGKAKELINNWSAITKEINELDEFMQPVAPVDLIVFGDKKLRETWDIWKDYLNEQHGFVIRTRMELYSMHLLTRLSSGDPVKAVEYLEYAMSHGYKRFFKLDENTKEKEVTNDSDW